LSTLTPNPTLDLDLGRGPASPSSPAELARRAGADSGAGSEPVYWGLPLSAWLKVGLIALLMAALFRFNLARLWTKTNPFYGQKNWEHTFFIPLIVLFYLYVWRDDLLNPKPLGGTRRVQRLRTVLGAWLIGMVLLWGLAFFPLVLFRPSNPNHPLAYAPWALLAVTLATLAYAFARRESPEFQARCASVVEHSSGWLGAFITVFGILFSFWGIWPGQNDYFKDVGMVIALFGVVLWLTGWGVMRTAWFPVLFLLCGIPWPDQFYSWVAGPLQELAAWVAVKVLNVFAVAAGREGTKIVMAGHGNVPRVLNVAEACAGLRSLMTFITVAGAVAFLTHRPLWQKLIISASAVPIAILCNVMRVSGQGLLDHYHSPEWSQGFAHGFAGLVMLVPGFFMILAVCWILDNLFIEEVDEVEKKAMSSSRVVARPQPALALAAGAPAVAAAGGGAVAAPAKAKVTVIPPKPGVAQKAALAPAKPAAPAAPAASAAPAGPAVSGAPAAPAVKRTVVAPAKPAAAGAAVAKTTPAPAAKPAAAGTPAAPRPAVARPAPAAGAAPVAKPAAPVTRPAGAAPAPGAAVKRPAGAPAAPVAGQAAPKKAAPTVPAAPRQPGAPAKPAATPRPADGQNPNQK
jgi:exosortase